MPYSWGLFRKGFPFHDFPRTLKRYHKDVQMTKYEESYDIFNSVQRVNAALRSDESFVFFWNQHCKGRPEAEAYLCGSPMAIDQQYALTVSGKYRRFVLHRRLSDLSTAEVQKIQLEFVALRPTVYHSFLEKEATRLNCNVSEVRPKVLVLPLEGDGRQSEFCSLPDDIFVKILALLETVEIFRMTLVCRSWRNLIYQNASVLTKAEHSLCTHLLTFTEWMDQSKVVKGEDVRDHHWSCCWSLLKWCSNVAQNLETLVLHEIFQPYGDIMRLLRQSPNLKHLHLELGNIDERCETKLQLPKLETLISEDLDCVNISKFVVQAFTSSDNLRVFKGHLYARDIDSIIEKRLNQDAFSNLMALQLNSPKSGLLEKLATLDQLQLKYLHLWDEFRLSQFRQHDNQHKIDKRRNALHHLLSKQNQLEVLVSLWKFELDQSTIKLMTEQQQNLKSALLSFRVRNLDNEEGLESSDESDEPSESSVESDGSYESSDGSDESSFDSIDGRDQFDDQDALVSFEEMLLEKDPSRDLSAFVFLVKDERSISFSENAMTEFSIYQDGDEHSDMFEKWSLSCPAMRRRLGIEY